MLAVVVLNFTLIQLAPGDPVTVLVGDYPVPQEYMDRVRADFGLDRSVPEQLVAYVRQLATGDFGFSFANRQPVLSLIWSRTPATLLLMGTSMLLAVIGGILLGAIAARYRGSSVDLGAQAASLTGYSLPDFWLGQMLIILFAVNLAWLPSQGSGPVRGTPEGWAGVVESARYLALPALTLSVRFMAIIARMTRATLLEVMRNDYIIAARARGAGDLAVLVRHGMRNAAIPVLTVIGYNFGLLLAGSALVETVFSWPGLGRLLFDSIVARDYPVLTGTLVIVSIGVLVVNLVTDFLYTLIDPRIRYSAEARA